MATIQDVKTKIQGLIDKGNEATGGSDTDLSSVIGTLIGSMGGSVVIKSGQFKNVGTQYTLKHGLGVLPDLFMIFSTSGNTVSGVRIAFCRGFSEKIYTKLNNTDWKRQQLLTYASASGTLQWSYTNCDYAMEDTSGPLHNATETSITIGNSSYQLINQSTIAYRWLAIGGL